MQGKTLELYEDQEQKSHSMLFGEAEGTGIALLIIEDEGVEALRDALDAGSGTLYSDREGCPDHGVEDCREFIAAFRAAAAAVLDRGLKDTARGEWEITPPGSDEA